jgi:hypothetical protein
MDLKYSASPRILFETAVLKASMPAEDYDIESLLARVQALEEKLANGVPVQVVAGTATRAEQPAAVQKPQEPPKAEPSMPVYEEDYSSFDVPPDETQTGGYAYFDGPIEPTKQASAPSPTRMSAGQTSTPKVGMPQSVAGDAKLTFGAFLRSVRKTAKSGVLVTMCMDLDCRCENGVFVLYTSSDTVYRSLKKDEHYALLVQSFENIGVPASGFDVRLCGKTGDAFQARVEEIRETFGGVKVDVK